LLTLWRERTDKSPPLVNAESIDTSSGN
jgi:preprotein translocase subunit SecF